MSEKKLSPDTRVAVIGLGYVGLPLAVALAKHFDATGFDINRKRVDELKTGQDRTGEIEPDKMRASQLKLTTSRIFAAPRFSLSPCQPPSKITINPT